MSTQEQLDRYLKFLEADPENQHLIKDAANCAYDLRDFTQALSISSKGAALYPKNLEIIATQALANLALGKIEEATSLLQALVASDGQKPVLRYNLAYCLALSSQFQDAHAYLTNAEDEYANLPQMLHLKVQVLHYLGEVEEAIALANRILENHPDDSKLHGMLSSLYIDKSDFEDAKQHAEFAIKSGQANHDAYASLGTLALGEQDDEHALQYFEHSIQLKANNGRAWLGKAMAQMLQNHLPQAQDSFSSALKYMPKHLGTWQALAWCQIAQQDLSGAEATINTALGIDDTFAESHGVLAIVQLAKGHTDLAQSSIRRSLGLDRESFSGLYAQALLLKQQGKEEASDKLIQGMLDAPLMPDQLSLRQVLVKHMDNHSK